jgi:NAD-dependent deacetylase
MRASHIVILTGAGVSAESGLGTFRDVGGLWTKYDLADVATPEGYAKNPGLVLDFYNARRANCRDAAPNAAHRAIARLQREYPGRVTLVTQNIDDLHERGGAAEVIHMHGQIMRASHYAPNAGINGAGPATWRRTICVIPAPRWARCART